MASTSDRHGQPNPASEADGIDDVGHDGEADDQRRVPSIDPFHTLRWVS